MKVKMEKISEDYINCLEVHCKMAEWVYPDAIALSLGQDPKQCCGIADTVQYKNREEIILTHINRGSLLSESRLSIDLEKNITHQTFSFTPLNFIIFLDKLRIPYPPILKEKIELYIMVSPEEQRIPEMNEQFSKEKNSLTPKEEASVVKILSALMANYWGDEITQLTEAKLVEEIQKMVFSVTGTKIHYQTAIKYVKQAKLFIKSDYFGNKAI